MLIRFGRAGAVRAKIPAVNVLFMWSCGLGFNGPRSVHPPFHLYCGNIRYRVHNPVRGAGRSRSHTARLTQTPPVTTVSPACMPKRASDSIINGYLQSKSAGRYSSPAIRPDMSPCPVIPVEAGVPFIIHSHILSAEPFAVFPDRTDFDADPARGDEPS